MDRKELNQRKAALLNKQEAVLTAAETAKRKLTDAEDADFKALSAEIADIEQTVVRLDAINKSKSELAQSTSQPVVDPGSKKTNKFGSRILSAEYNDSFYGSFKNRSFTNAALGEGGTTDGGNLVPTIGPEGEIIALAPNEASMRGLALVIPTTNDLRIAAQLTKTVAAVKLESRTTNHAFSQSMPLFTQVTLSAYMSGAYVPITIELAQDAPALQPFLSADLSRGVNNFEEDVYVNGSGTNEPEGILAGADAGQTAPLTAEDSLDMLGTLNSAYYNNAQWLMNRLTGIAFRKEQLEANQFAPYWVSVNGTDYLHGYKVNYSSAMPSFSASPSVAGKIAFGDFKTAMVIGDRGGPALQIITDQITQLENGIIRVYGYRRTDSRVRVSEAVKIWTVTA